MTGPTGPSRCARSLAQERGFAILIVLWTLVLISLIMAHVVAMARSETDIAASLRAGAQLSAQADGGIYDAVFHVLDQSAAHWTADGTRHLEQGPSASLLIRIRNEAAKVDLNGAPRELLAALLQQTGMGPDAATEISANIVSWRTQAAADTPSDLAYRSLGYLPPHAPFESVEELRYVLGMTPQIMDRLSPYITVWHRGEVDPSGAAPPVLRALKAVFGPAADRRSFLAFSPLDRAAAQVVDIVAVSTRGTARAGREAVVRIGGPDTRSLFSILNWQNLP
jgi:general secretion pathway protein K